jgi:hypothetical protein
MNKEKIIEVLRAEEALIVGKLESLSIKRCGHAGRCAIGALLWAAGQRDLEHCDSVYSDTLEEEKEYDDGGMALMRETYDVTHADVTSIMAFNDGAAQGKFGAACDMAKYGSNEVQDRKRVCAVIKHIEEM